MLVYIATFGPKFIFLVESIRPISQVKELSQTKLISSHHLDDMTSSMLRAMTLF